jgi:hypothetical protein
MRLSYTSTVFAVRRNKQIAWITVGKLVNNTAQILLLTIPSTGG